MIVDGKTIKGYWPGAVGGKIPGAGDQLVSYPSHPYAMKMNSDYFVALAATFEERYGVEFSGIRAGAGHRHARAAHPVQDEHRRRHVRARPEAASATGSPIGSSRLAITVKDDFPLRIDVTRDPFLDERLRVANLPESSRRRSRSRTRCRARRKSSRSRCSASPAKPAGARRAISEIVKWLNYVTGNRVLTIAADLSESVNLEHGNLWGHYDPVRRIRPARGSRRRFRRPGNASTAIGLVGQNASVDPDRFAGVWAFSGTYGAFTPLMYLPARVWSQQNQDSKFRTGVLHILAGHSGPETAADARTHFGIFSPQVWKLFPRGQVIKLSFWDYNDVAPGYFAAAEIAAREKKVGVIVIEVARPDFPVADRSTFADTRPDGRREGLLRHPRLRAWQGPARLRRRAGLELDLQPRQGAAEARRGRYQREDRRGDQRGAVRSPAGGVPERRCSRLRRSPISMFVSTGTRRCGR